MIDTIEILPGGSANGNPVRERPAAESAMKTSRCWHQMSVVELALISTDLAPTVSMFGTGTSRPISGGCLVCRIILVTPMQENYL
jgi:hypothetical protein